MWATDSFPEKRQGRTCFAGTRVTVDLLFDYLADGCTVEQFLEDYDGVTRDQAERVIRRAGAVMVARGPGRKEFRRRLRGAWSPPTCSIVAGQL